MSKVLKSRKSARGESSMTNYLERINAQSKGAISFLYHDPAAAPMPQHVADPPLSRKFSFKGQRVYGKEERSEKI